MELTNRHILWASKPIAGRTTGLALRTIENWAYSGAIAVNEFGEVDVLEILQRESDRLDKELEKLREGETPQNKLIRAQIRKTLADVGLLEWKLEEEKSGLISREEVESDLSLMREMAKEAFADVPGLLSEAIANEGGNPKKIGQLLTDAIYPRLQKLSDDLQAVE